MTQPTFVLSNRRLSEHSLAASSASASTTPATRKALAPPLRNSTTPNMDADIATVASISTPRITTTYEPATDVSRFMSTLPLSVSVSATTMDSVHNSPSPHQTALALAEAYNDVNPAAFELHNSSTTTSSISDLSSSTTTKTHSQPANAPCKTPVNFGIVAPGIYRSDFPKTENFSFLGTLGLKTIITLVKKNAIDPEFAHFMAANDINHCVIDMEGTKKKAIPADVMNAIMQTVCDKRNQPVLVHCNHGKHRTGCVVGVLRHLSGWPVSDILTEYNLYAGEKARDCDLAYLANFDVRSLSPRVSSSPFFSPPSLFPPFSLFPPRNATITTSLASILAGGLRSFYCFRCRPSARPAFGLSLANPIFLAFVLILIWSTTYCRLVPSLVPLAAVSGDQ